MFAAPGRRAGGSGYTERMAIRQPRTRERLRLRPVSIDMPPEGLTVDDWFALPDDGYQYELYEGVLVLMSAPSRIHQDIVVALLARLYSLATATGAYASVGPLGVVLSQKLGFLPDVVYVTPLRRAILSLRGIEEAPDIVVEVLSPSTKSFDRNSKLRAYLGAGVREVWLVDSQARVSTIWFAPNESATAAFGEHLPSRIADIGDGGLAAF